MSHGIVAGIVLEWAASLVGVSALFGWGHVDQGLTGQVQAAIDGLVL